MTEALCKTCRFPREFTEEMGPAFKDLIYCSETHAIHPPTLTECKSYQKRQEAEQHGRPG